MTHNVKKNKTNTNKTGGYNKTRKKSYKISNKTSSHIVKVFLEMLNMVKLYHWKTLSYSQHKATDELFEKLNKNIDRFIEVLIGKE